MITPAQLRSAARFGTGLRKENLLELADELERLRRCDEPRKHHWSKWECVAQTNNTKTFMRECEYCRFQQFTGPLKARRPFRKAIEVE